MAPAGEGQQPPAHSAVSRPGIPGLPRAEGKQRQRWKDMSVAWVNAA